MPERQNPDREDDIPAIETPVIDIQDLEHKPNPVTRVHSKDARAKPELPATWTGESESDERR